MNCPECKSDVSPKATACPQCGYPLQEPKGDKWVCPECGEKLGAEFDSCWKCAGKKTVGVTNKECVKENEAAPANSSPLLSFVCIIDILISSVGLLFVFSAGLGLLPIVLLSPGMELAKLTCRLIGARGIMRKRKWALILYAVGFGGLSIIGLATANVPQTPIPIFLGYIWPAIVFVAGLCHLSRMK